MPIESGKHFWKQGAVGSSFAILVDNLPFEVGVPWFRKFFSKFGKIAEVFIPANRSNRTGNRYGYVRFAFQKDVGFAIANANGLWVGRRNLIVKRASYDRGMASVGSNSQMMGIPQAEKQKDIEARRTLNLQPIATSWLQTSAVVKLMTLSTPDLVLKAFHEFKMKDIQVRSLGGMYMIITFQSKDDRDQAMANSVIRSWFSYFEPWNGDAASLSRLVWINCRGMPLNIWCHNSFKRIGEMWGEFIALDVETIHGLSYDVGRLLIVTEKQERIDEWINICVRGRNYKVKVWEEECKDPFNDLEILKIASQQCSVKVYKPKLKLNISKDDDGLTGDKNVESQGFDESNAVANNHHADASYNEAINATLEKDQHLILPKPGSSLDMEVVNSFSEANSYSSCGIDSIVDDSAENVINEKDGNILEEDVLNHIVINDEGLNLDPIEDNHVPIQTAVKGLQGKKRRKTINEILGFSKVNTGNSKGRRSKNKCVVLRSAIAAAALSASISSDGINNRNKILLDEARTIWEINKMHGIGYDGDEEEVISKIAEMEAQNKERVDGQL